MNEVKPLVEKTGDKSNSPEAHATIHDRTGLFIAVVSLVVGCLGIGIAIASLIVTDNARDRATIAENHWRNYEVDLRSAQSDIKKLQEELRHDR